MNSEYLFIGGERDGERLRVPPDRRSVELEMRQDRPKGKAMRARHPVPTELYDRMRFTGETEAYDVFVLRGLNGNVVMRALIECYKALPPEAS